MRCAWSFHFRTLSNISGYMDRKTFPKILKFQKIFHQWRNYKLQQIFIRWEFRTFCNHFLVRSSWTFESFRSQQRIFLEKINRYYKNNRRRRKAWIYEDKSCSSSSLTAIVPVSLAVNVRGHKCFFHWPTSLAFPSHCPYIFVVAHNRCIF